MNEKWTWHQKKKWQTFNRLKNLFKNPKTGRTEPRTWKQLANGIPKGTLSPLLNDWIAKGWVEIKVKVVAGKRQTVYLLRKLPNFRIEHKDRETGPFEEVPIPFRGETKRVQKERVSSGKGSVYERRVKRVN